MRLVISTSISLGRSTRTNLSFIGALDNPFSIQVLTEDLLGLMVTIACLLLLLIKSFTTRLCFAWFLSAYKMIVYYVNERHRARMQGSHDHK